MSKVFYFVIFFLCINLAGARADWQGDYDKAVAVRDFKTIQSLLKANPEKLTDQRSTSLLYKAVEMNNIELSVLLLSAGHEKNYWDGGYLTMTYLEIAVQNGFFDLAKAIVDYFEIDEYTMREAISKGRLDLVRLFIKKGFNPSRRLWGHGYASLPIFHSNAFVHAAQADKLEIAEYLYSLDAEINSFDLYNDQSIPIIYNSHNTALDYAIKHDNKEFIAWLKKRGAKTFYQVLDEMSVDQINSSDLFSVAKAFPKTDSLRVRERPGLEGAVVGVVNSSDAVSIVCQTATRDQIDGFDNPWLYVITRDGRRGWVYGGYIDAKAKMQ